MPHFAELDNTSTVINVFVADDTYEGKELDLCRDTHLTYRQTSYNTRGGVHYNSETGEASADQSKALRKNYPGNGFSYDANLDAFIPPKPYESWVLNETTCLWEPPVAMPTEGGSYAWNEAEQGWDSVPAIDRETAA